MIQRQITNEHRKYQTSRERGKGNSLLTEGKESEERGNATNEVFIHPNGNGEQWNYPIGRNENPN